MMESPKVYSLADLRIAPFEMPKHLCRHQQGELTLSLWCGRG
jgi:hypothetical protein